jgi:hypothetical protein
MQRIYNCSVPATTQSTYFDSSKRIYMTSRRSRAFELTIVILLCIWVLFTAYLWLTDQASWALFLGALLIAAVSILRTYSVFTSRLILSHDGIHYFAYGASYFAPWDSIKLDKRSRLGGTRNILSFAEPIPPTQKTTFGKLMMPLPIPSIDLQPFGWPTEQLQADLERYAPHLFVKGIESSIGEVGE